MPATTDSALVFASTAVSNAATETGCVSLTRIWNCWRSVACRGTETLRSLPLPAVRPGPAPKSELDALTASAAAGARQTAMAQTTGARILCTRTFLSQRLADSCTKLPQAPEMHNVPG